MNGFTAPACIFPSAASAATNRIDARRACASLGRAAIGLLIAAGSLVLWSGCMTTSKTRPAVPPALSRANVPAKGVGASPAAPVTVPQAPAMAVPPKRSQPASAPGIVTVGPDAVVIRLTMLVESEPAGATIVVDGRPVGKTPLQLGVPASPLGFFRDYVEIRARFIAENETEVSQTATEEFSPREKVPAVLHFTPAGVRRTVRE